MKTISSMKRWIKWTVGILLFPIALFLILLILLYIPQIQNFVKDKTFSYLNETTGLDVSVERIRLSFPLSLVIDNVKASSEGEILLDVNKFVADIQFMPILKGQIEVDGIQLVDAVVNTKDMIPGLGISGNVGNFYLQSHGVDLKKEEVILDDVVLENSSVALCLADTSASDTSSTPVNWKIKIKKVDVGNVGFSMKMPLDTLDMRTYLEKAVIRNGDIDLGNEKYELEHFELNGASFGLATASDTSSVVFNPLDMMFSEIEIRLDSVRYGYRQLNAILGNLALKEKSGFEIVSGTGNFHADNENIYASNIVLGTRESSFLIEGEAGWTLLDSVPYGKLRLDADLKVAPGDAEYFIGKLHKDIPRKPILVKMGLGGTLDNMELSELSLKWDKIIDFNANGSFNNILDSLSRSAQIGMEMHTGNLGFAEKVFNLTEAGVRIPSGMKLQSEVKYKNNVCDAFLDLKESNSSLSVLAKYGIADDSYKIGIDISSMDVSHFYAIDSLSPITMSLNVKGKGFDLYNKKTNAIIKGNIEQLAYADYDLSGTNINGNFSENNGNIKIRTKNDWLKSVIALGLNTGKHESSLKLTANIKDIALQKLAGTSYPFNMAVNFDVDFTTDMKKMGTVIGRIGDVALKMDGKTVTPKDITFDAYTNVGTSEFSVNAGDMFMTVNGDRGATELVEVLGEFSDRLSQQLVEHSLDYYELKNYLPDLYFELTAKNDNPFSNYLKMMNVNIDNTRLRLSCNPNTGVAGDFLLKDIKVDSIQLDSAYLWLVQDTTGIRYKMIAVNNSKLNEYISNTIVSGEITGQYASILLDMFNPQGEKGLYLGCRSDFLNEGIKLSFFPEYPSFLFRRFSLNDNNYVMLRDSMDIDADLKFMDENGTGLSFVSSYNKRGNKKLTASLSGIGLAEIRSLVPSLIPDIEGVLSASLSYTKLKRTFSLSSNIDVDKFVYEKKPVADLSLVLNYLPLEDETQMVMAKFVVNDNDAAVVRGKFRPGENREFIYNMDLTEFPLSLANSFVPDNMINLEGTANGTFKMTGSFAKPVFNGEMTFNETSLFIPMAGAKFRFDNTPLTITDSKLKFNRFSLFTRTDNPFDIDGTVDFSDFSNMKMNMRFNTSNYELLNAKKSKESLVYGKAYIDANVMVNGPVSGLKVRGDVRLLGNTNLSYILKESSLTVQDRLGETVTFVNLNDTASTKKKEVEQVVITGMDVLLNASVDPTAKVNIYLSESGDNKVEVAGGGDLSMGYSPQGDLSLTGRYTFSGGKISYSLPMVTIADFSVKEGGFIQWTGNPMNPSMNLTAVKRVRTDVPNSDGEGSRKTNFDVSVNISNTLEDLGLSFGIDAPEDAEVQNELTAMGEDERVKNALFMMAFNSYLGNGANFNVNNALNSLMQREISSVAGKVQAVDLSLGMENPNGDEGFENMDISYKISKRFWNDRFSISLGGKISTRSNAAESNKESFIDNISVDYRLDNSGTRYVKLFHNKNYESILEGEITETGIGIVLRKKMMKLSELFVFKRNKNKTVAEDDKKK